MGNWKLMAAEYTNPTNMRIIYILLALLSMALAAGAPDAFGGTGGG